MAKFSCILQQPVFPDVPGTAVYRYEYQGVPELWLMSPYILHSSITKGVNIPEPSGTVLR